PSATLRIPLQSGDKDKANLLLNGEISRVDPATADRITQAILQKTAEYLLDLSTDLRRQGLFILPFRCYTMTMTPDGTLSYPSPQAIALPTDIPPHPEITAASATDDALTIAIRIPVSPHRLKASAVTVLPDGHSLRTYISYPLYIPDPKEIRGSLGSVKSATGGNTTGIRFAFLSTSSIKASVAAPEKYYELAGNQRTGYRMSSKTAPTPDYSCYASLLGHVPPFSRESLLVAGNEVSADTDPMDWIADWEEAGEGYLPASLPYVYRNPESSDASALPDGIDIEEIPEIAETLGTTYILLTRPMALASDSRSRRNAEPRAIRSIQVLGLSDAPALAILYGSYDCRHWEAIRSFDPRLKSHILSPPRLWWRLLLYTAHPAEASALLLNLQSP
ncbi:MAG: hypothetical protein K2K23_01375, partial [Muribaculaceae bacterium]|nr:hypothetical protein [Muribaculaceae bacterium]